MKSILVKEAIATENHVHEKIRKFHFDISKHCEYDFCYI